MIKLILIILLSFPSMVLADEVASRVKTNTSGFNGILSASDTTVQLALDTIDDSSTDISGLVPYTGATANVNLGTYDLITDTITASTSAGTLLESANGTDVAILGAGNTANSLFYGAINVSGLNNSTLAITNSSAYTQSGTSANAFTGTTTFSHATYQALFTGSGHVGINDTTPDAALDIAWNSSDTNIFLVSSSESLAGDIFKVVSTSGGAVGVGETGSPDARFEVIDGASYTNVFALSLTADGDGDIMLVNDSGNMGLGTKTISARFHVVRTTEQIRTGYDLSNYFSTTVSSAGLATFDAVGSGAGFVFSDAVRLASLTSNGPVYTSSSDGTLNIGTTTGTGTEYVLSTSPTIQTKLTVSGASGLDGATPIETVLYSTNSGTWTDEAIMARLVFGSADTGGGAGELKTSISAYIDDTSGSDIGLSFYTTTGGTGSYSEKMRIDHIGQVAIGTTQTQTATTNHKFSVVGSGLQFYASDVLTDDTIKNFRIGMPHYDNGTNTRPFIGWYMTADNGTNNTYIGGGTSAGYAATNVRIMTAADSTTQTGSTRFVVYSDGKISAGNTTANGALTVGENRSFSGMTSSLSGRAFGVEAITITDTDQTGTVGNRNVATIRPVTFASTNSVTLTEAASLYIASAPVAGTNTTITYPYAHWIDAGRTRIDGGQRLGYVAKTGTYTASVNDDYVINCTANTFTVNLPTAVNNSGQVFIVKNSGTGTITVDGDGTETIDGALTYVMATQYMSVTVMSNGANWIII